jgi:para-nitrobenzyl esterase
MRPSRVLMPVLLMIVALAGVLGLACAGSTPTMERVQLDSGPISGEHAADLWVFKGIPYAAPPVGDLRWKPPRPVTPWEDVLECASFGPACPQPASTETAYLTVGGTSEDCLYLNVWSSAKSPQERLPVMVWIHGGSFETGAGSMAVYDGGVLASRGVVVVTINYRVGPLGFLAHPALSADSTQGISGNYGLLDQIAALKWVQKNISAFGGDPAKVTAFGESAGAISILDLIVSPQADGLFQRAIVQSGILLDRGFGVSTTATLEDAEQAGTDYAQRLGVDSAGDVLSQLRARTPDELLAAAANDASVLAAGLTWKPVADGYVLPDLPTTLWAEGRRSTVPLLIGSNKDEGNLFLQGLTLSTSEYQVQMQNVFGKYADEALSLYPVAKPADIVPAFSRMLTEVGFASTARFAASSMSAGAQAASVFLYEFTRVPFKNLLGAFHGVEIPYVFGNTSQFTGLGTIEQTDLDLSAALGGYWTRFAATGDPNGGGSPVWPEYDAASDQHLELGDSIEVGSGLYKTTCDLADKVRGIQ